MQTLKYSLSHTSQPLPPPLTPGVSTFPGDCEYPFVNRIDTHTFQWQFFFLNQMCRYEFMYMEGVDGWGWNIVVMRSYAPCQFSSSLMWFKVFWVWFRACIYPQVLYQQGSALPICCFLDAIISLLYGKFYFLSFDIFLRWYSISYWNENICSGLRLSKEYDLLR